LSRARAALRRDVTADSIDPASLTKNDADSGFKWSRDFDRLGRFRAVPGTRLRGQVDL